VIHARTFTSVIKYQTIPSNRTEIWIGSCYLLNSALPAVWLLEAILEWEDQPIYNRGLGCSPNRVGIQLQIKGA